MKLKELDLGNLEKITFAEVTPEVKETKKEKKKKSFWDNVFNKGKMKKPNMVAVIFLRNNGIAEPIHVESKKGFLSIRGKVYHEDRDCIYTITKNRLPLAIIPEWSMIPYGTKNWHDKPMLEKFAELQDHALRGIRHAELVKMGDKDNKKLNPKVVVAIIIAAVVGIALLQNYI